VTLRGPEVAPVGTITEMLEGPELDTRAATPLKVT